MDNARSHSDIGTELKTNFDSMLKIATDLVALSKKKDAEYGSSWKKRGGIGAFFTAWRKADRLEAQLKQRNYDIFDVSDDSTSTESLDETIKDFINYLLLVQETRDAIRHHLAMQEVVHKVMDDPSSGGPTPAYVNQDGSSADARTTGPFPLPNSTVSFKPTFKTSEYKGPVMSGVPVSYATLTACGTLGNGDGGR